MKKILTILLVLVMMVSITACGRDTSVDEGSGSNNHSGAGNEDGEGNNDDTSKPLGKKIEGTITGASTFSEGLAFVELESDDKILYCIDKNGYIVFETDAKPLYGMHNVIYSKFVNGHVLLGGGVCDTKGNITYPEDVGATKFYDIAFSGGYILAEKVTSTYESAKQEVGVMNMDFEWIVQPSEDLYAAFEFDLRHLSLINSLSFYQDDIIYFEECKKCLNIKSGKVIDQFDGTIPSSKWIGFSNGFCFDEVHQNEYALDLRDHPTLSAYGCYFVNGHAPVTFHNPTSNIDYFTIIDEKGEFLFEPIELERSVGWEVEFDGEYVLMGDETFSSKLEYMWCYNSSGEFMGEISAASFGPNQSFSYTIGDGIILITNYSAGGYNTVYTHHYFNPDFTPLF